MSRLVSRGILSGQFDPRNLANLVAWVKADGPMVRSTTGFTGTGTVAQTTTTVTGVGTAFLSEVVVGDKISGTGFNETVTAIATNTSLTVDTSGTVGAGASFTITPQAGITERVTTWSDQSGLGHDFVQATLSKCPTFVEAALNGRPLLRFDKNNDTMALATFTLVQPEHVFFVGKWNQAFVSNDCAYEGSSANNTMRMARTATGTISISGGTVLSSTGNTPESYHIYAMEFNSTTSAHRIDENAVTASGNAGTGAPGGIVLNSAANGTTSFGGLDMAELLVYNRILSPTERLKVENYLANKYGITLTP